MSLSFDFGILWSLILLIVISNLFILIIVIITFNQQPQNDTVFVYSLYLLCFLWTRCLFVTFIYFVFFEHVCLFPLFIMFSLETVFVCCLYLLCSLWTRCLFVPFIYCIFFGHSSHGFPLKACGNDGRGRGFNLQCPYELQSSPLRWFLKTDLLLILRC